MIMEPMDPYKQIFGTIFVLSNRLQVMGDRFLGGDMTVSQWILTAAILQSDKAPPTLGEMAAVMGSSHQNVKQLAVQLQQKGYLHIYRDVDDLRTCRLILTDKNKILWDERQQEIKQLLIQLFMDLNEDEIDLMYQCLQKLHNRMEMVDW